MPGHSKWFKSRYIHQEVSHRCFTYRLEQLTHYGLKPAIRWRWTSSEKGFAFNRNDVARSIWMRQEIQQSFTKEEQKDCINSLRNMLHGYPEHVHHTDVFSSIDGYMFVGTTIDLQDLCFISGLRDPNKEYTLADFPMPVISQRWPQSTIIRRALAQELVTGRFYKAVQAQSVLLDGVARPAIIAQDVSVQVKSSPEDEAPAPRQVRKCKPACPNPQDLSALAAAALGLTTGNN